VSGTSRNILPAPTPVDIGIVAALPIEIGGFRDLLKNVRVFEDAEGRKAAVVEGDLGERRIALIVGGTGAASARKATDRLLVGHRPTWLISAGFGGALDPTLARGDVVVIRDLIDGTASGAKRLSIDFGGLDDSSSPAGKRILRGSLVTVAGIVRTANEKRALRERTGADLVDMESYAVASLCVERNQRFLGVRVISDEAAQELPPEVLTILGPTGGFRFGATLGSLWKRPSSVKDLWRLYENATESADRLAKVLAWLIDRLT
jgi:adenosylhomocysteine nucleosidase